MSKNILKDNFDKKINVKNENEYDDIFKDKNIVHSINCPFLTFKMKKYLSISF